MLELLKKQNRLKISTLLAVMSFSSFLLSLLRVYLTGSKLFLFLNWNLFLAFIPLFFSTLIVLNPKMKNKKLPLILLLILWILFFPNALYIITDLFHLRIHSLMPAWFDLILILSFAWTGFLFGFLSLIDIENLLSEYTNTKFISLISVFLLFAASFGIYLGRYLRWNSWDIIISPFALINDIIERFINPFSHTGTWGMTILFGLLLNMFYWSIKFLKSEK
ncbi:MAG: DUF1361 domain-containing protein [Bacteroidales bacterium]|nr:DUF1361 domain-containing protein [Bacteroidales bacterium]MBN2757153.1 DUF1361 domain-containing protein [Bacteroidales bacterium]